jgi:hypothetical protein
MEGNGKQSLGIFHHPMSCQVVQNRRETNKTATVVLGEQCACGKMWLELNFCIKNYCRTNLSLVAFFAVGLE